MTKDEREVCCQVLGFIQTVARAENNVFAEGAKEMERLLTTMLFSVVISDLGEIIPENIWKKRENKDGTD